MRTHAFTTYKPMSKQLYKSAGLVVAPCKKKLTQVSIPRLCSDDNAIGVDCWHSGNVVQAPLPLCLQPPNPLLALCKLVAHTSNVHMQGLVTTLRLQATKRLVNQSLTSCISTIAHCDGGSSSFDRLDV